MTVVPRARIDLYLDASPDAVFDAWVRPEVVERWLFKSDTNRLEATTDPRPGGTYSIVEHEGDAVIEHDGTYATVDRPSRLSFDLVVPAHFDGTALIEVWIRPDGIGSQLEFTARGDGPPDAQQLWEKMLHTLATTVD